MAWYNSDWKYRKKISVDNTKVSATETDFTVKVDIVDTDVKDKSRVDGYDIVFTTDDEITLASFEIVDWDYTSGTLKAYVKVPSLSSSTDTDFYMYYGNINQTVSLANTRETWNDNVVAVYHMNDHDGTNISQINSSANTFRGVPNYNINWLDFDGSSDYVEFSDKTEFEMSDSDFTIGAWIQLDSYTDENTIFGKWLTTGNQREYQFLTKITTGELILNTSSDGTATSTTETNEVIPLDQPIHVTVVKSGTATTFYINGISVEDDGTAVDATINTGTATVKIGAIDDGTADDFDGRIGDVFVYRGRALTGAEVKSIYDGDIKPTGNLILDTSLSGTSVSSFDGTDDNIDYGDNTDFEFGANDFTISAWVNIDDFTDENAIFSKWNTTGNQREFTFQTVITTGELQLITSSDGTATKTLSADTVISLDQPIHVVVTKSDTDAIFYINGIADTDDSVALDGTINTGTANAMIGELDGGGPNSFNGEIWDVKVWNGTALKPNQVRDLYESNTTPTTNLVLDTTLSPRNILDFDGVDDKVDCGSDTSIDNMFDGSGGQVSAWIMPRSDGETNAGRVIEKRDAGTGWTIVLDQETNGFVRFYFQQDFSTTDGVWTSGKIIPLNTPTFFCVDYDSDDINNNPTIYIYNSINGFQTLTVGDGLNENQTPVGTRSTDAIEPIIFGNRDTQDRTFDGGIWDAFVISTGNGQAKLTSSQIETLAITGNYQDYDFTAYWPMDEGTGNDIIDKSRFNNHGTNTGGTWTSSVFDDSTQGNTGTISGAVSALVTKDTSTPKHGMEFDGTNDNIDLGDNADFEFGSSDFTIGAWIILDDYSIFNTIFNKWGPSDEFAFGTKITTGELQLFTSNDGSVSKSNETTDIIPLNTLTHVAVTKSGTSSTFYINGIEVADDGTALDATLFSSTTNAKIGLDASNNSDFDGKISDLFVYNGTALTAAEILTIYNGGSKPTNNLVLDTSLEGRNIRDFDGTDDVIDCGTDTSIDDIWDGSGGQAGAWIMPDSDGESSLGRIFDKTGSTTDGWLLWLKDETGDFTHMSFSNYFNSNLPEWKTTSAIIPLNTPTFVMVDYELTTTGDTTANPIIYIYNSINGFQTLTVGDGLTEVTSPTGTRDSDSTHNLIIGNNSATTRTFDGGIWNSFMISTGNGQTKLTTGQIETLARTGNYDDYSFTALYKLDDDLETAKQTGAGSAGDGTITGATKVQIVEDNSGQGNHGDVDGAIQTYLKEIHHGDVIGPTQVSGKPVATPTNNGILMGTRTYGDFDGVDDEVDCGSGASIDNIFDGSGGQVSAWIMPDSDGEGNNGRILQKGSSYSFRTLSESNGFCKLKFLQIFSGDHGEWETINTIIPLNVPTFVCVEYDADDVANNITLYIYNSVNGFQTLTVGSGLTELTTPTGSRDDDSAGNLFLGNNSAGSATFDGGIWNAFVISTGNGENKLTPTQLETLATTGNYGDLTFTSYWPMDETSGATVYRDEGVQDNAGTITGVTITEGRPDFGERPVWDSGLRKHLDFDGVDDKVTITATSAINAIWDGSGGQAMIWIMPDSDGEGSTARFLNKNNATQGWQIGVQDESNGWIDIWFSHIFSTTNGQWETTNRVIPLNVPTFVCVEYDSDATTNNPIFYIYNTINGFQKLEVGSGLTEVNTPSGTRDADTVNLAIGNNQQDTTRTFDGGIWDVALISTGNGESLLSEVEIEELARYGNYGKFTFTAHWPLDEDTGTTYRNEGVDTQTGSNSGATITAGNMNYGKVPVFHDTIGKHLDFDGTNDDVDFGDNTDFEFGASDFTIGAWIRIDDYSDYNTIFSKWLTTGNQEEFTFDTKITTGELRLVTTANGSTDSTTETDLVIPLNTDIHVAVTKNGTDATFYINGVAVADDATALDATLHSGTAKAMAGDTETSGVEFNGRISNLFVYNGTSLTARQVKDVYLTGKLPSENLVLHCPMDETSGTTVNDLSNGRHHGTNNGATITDGSIAYDGDMSFRDDAHHLDFDAIDDEVDCGSDSSLDNIFDGGGQAGAWILPRSDGESDGIIMNTRVNSGDTGWRLLVNDESNGFVQFEFVQGFPSAAFGIGLWETDTIIPLNVPTFVCVEYDADSSSNVPTAYTYNIIQGFQKYTMTAVFTPSGTRGSDTANDLLMGTQHNGSNTFDGGIWNAFVISTGNGETLLTEEEIKNLATKGNWSDYTFTSWWKLNEGTGTSVTDSGVESNTGTVTGASWVTGRTFPTSRFDGGINFEGISSHIIIPYDSSMSFGNNINDKEFSIFSMIKMLNATDFPIISSSSTSSTNPEYRLHVDSSDKLGISVYDNTSGNSEGRLYNTTSTSDEEENISVGSSYDASEASTGLDNYRNGSAVDDTANDAGTYTATHNFYAPTRIGEDAFGTNGIGRLGIILLYNDDKNTNFMTTMDNNIRNNNTFISLGVEETSNRIRMLYYMLS